jgi:hypothetical protein
MPSRPSILRGLRPIVAGLAALLIAGCGGTPTSTPASPTVSSAPPVTQAPSVAADRIEHPTGPGDVVLRAETRGGFVRLEYVMARVPEFTLYGDGRVLLVPEGADALGGVDPAVPPLREAHLTEDEVQALLRFALVDGRLGTARDQYLGGNMDAPETVFQLNADGAERSILVTGLSEEPAPGPDAATLRAFAELVSRLRSIATDADYASDGTVAILADVEEQPGEALEGWPFATLLPRDFPQPADDAAIPLPKRLLSADESAEARGALGDGPSLTRVEGPDGHAYVLLLRPALPDELAAGS